MRVKRVLMVGSAIVSASFFSSQANALNIVLNDIGGVTGSQAEAGFAIAASYWESVISDNVTINFDVGFSNLGPGILGGTGTNLVEYVPISDYYSALAAHGNSALDAAALANLAPLSANGSVSTILPAYRNATTKNGVATTGSRVGPDGKAITNTIAIASSTAKALGFSTSGADAEIQFSNTFAFDFDPTDGIGAGMYDFIGVAIHEMGHALGFISGVDDFDYSTGQSIPNIDNYWWGYALDLFRYSADGQLNWNFDTEAYFSIDGGANPFLGNANFSTGENNGDGWQASHWKAPGGCTNFVGIMNPYICSALVDSITAQDLGVFDAIGWNLNLDVLANPTYDFTTAQVYQAYYAGAVPEPASWAMMIAGFGLAGAALRRRRRTVTVAFA